MVAGGGRPFRFLNLLADHDQFEETVKAGWNTSVAGNAMYSIWQKLKAVKNGLKQLHIQHFANIEDEIKMASESLLQVQNALAHDYTNAEL